MGFQAIQLFGHVNTLGHQHQFLLQAIVFQLHFRVFQLRHQAIALPLQNFRHMGTYFGHFAANTFQALFNQRFQRLTFGFASDDEVVQRTVQRIQDLGGDGVQILLLCGHNARPAQNIDRVNFPFVALHFDPVGRVNQLLCQVFIENKFALRTGIWLKTQSALYFPAR